MYLQVNSDNKVVSFHSEKAVENYSVDILEKIGELYLVSDIPEPQQIEGKAPILYCNPETKELYYEYIDIPKTQEEIQQEVINTLGQELATLKIQLIMGGIL